MPSPLRLLVVLALCPLIAAPSASQSPAGDPVEKGQMLPAVVVPHAIVLDGPAPAGAPLAPIRSEDGWVEIVFEDFETPGFPGDGWNVFAQSGPEAYWGRSNHRASSGSWSMFSVGAGSGSPGSSGPYPNNARSWAIYGPFDLSDAGYADLTFDYWSQTESGYDFFGWYASTNGTDFHGARVSGSSQGWVDHLFDLTNVPTLGDVTGESAVWIAFLFESDFIITDEGTWVDDVRLRAYDGIPPGEIEVSTTSLTIVEPGARMWRAEEDAARARPEEYAPGRVVVRFEDHVNVDPARGTTSIPGIDAIGRQIGLRDVQPLLAPAGSDMRGRRAAGLDQIYILEFDSPVDAAAVAASYHRQPGVVYAEPDGYLYTLEEIDPPGRSIPDDPLFSSQWGLNNTGQAVPNGGGGTVGTVGADVNVLAAWSLETGSPTVSIAILDTGVDMTHPEFEGKILPGYDFIDNDDDPTPTGNAHGTAAAGIAAAAGNNGAGVAGVAYDASIIPIRVCATNQCSITAIAAAIAWAADQGASVISMSLGGGFTSAVADAVDYAYAQGSVIFASTGNGNTSTPSYPAALTNVISVGALSPCNDRKSPTTCDGEGWWGSSYGSGMDFLAPGTRIHTTDIMGSGGYSTGDYTATFNGTSAACPFAAGVGALLLSANPNLTPDEVRSIMQTAAVDLGPGGYDEQTGFGRLDAGAALQMAAAGALITIRNTGLGPLTITSISGDRPWLSLGSDGGVELAPNQRLFLQVDVDWAGVDGSDDANITIASDDPGNPLVIVAVSAIGSEQPPQAVDVDREVAGLPGWRMLAAPVEGVSVSSLAAQNLVQGVPGYYEEWVPNLFTSFDGQDWIAASAGDQLLAAGEGFIWYFWDVAFDPGGSSQSYPLPMDLTASGFEPADDVVVNLNAGAGVFTLAGNPYAVPIDAGLITGSIQDAIHVWDPNGPGYVTLSRTAGDTIDPWSGFFVEHDDAEPGQPLTIPRLARLERSAPDRQPEDVLLLELQLTGRSATLGHALVDAGTRVLFVDGATDGWDAFDGSKLAPLADEFVQIAFGGHRDGQPLLLAQDSRSRQPGPIAMPLHVSHSGASGTMHLSWHGVDALPSEWQITLHDLGTGATVDLREQASYAFSSSTLESVDQRDRLAPPDAPQPIGSRADFAAADEARFILALTPGAVDTEDGAATHTLALEGVYPNPAGAHATVRFTLPSAEPIYLEVFDVLGRRVALLADGVLEPGAHEIAWSTGGVGAGVYVVRLRTTTEQLATRVTVLH